MAHADPFIVPSANHGTGEVLLDKDEKIEMPPLRPYEMPGAPAEPLDIPPEPSEYPVEAGELTRDELRERAEAVDLPPLRNDELPETVVTIVRADPDDLLDDPSWGLCRQAPEIRTRQSRLLRPWDDEPDDDR